MYCCRGFPTAPLLIDQGNDCHTSVLTDLLHYVSNVALQQVSTYKYLKVVGARHCRVPTAYPSSVTLGDRKR